MNNVTLSGRLTKEPDVRYGGENNSVAIARFTLAVDDYKSTDFINIRALGKTAEWVEKWLQKGNKVELVGKIKTGHYTGRDGKEIYYTEVLASSVSFGETKAEAQQRQQAVGSRRQTTANTQRRRLYGHTRRLRRRATIRLKSSAAAESEE